MTEEKEKMKEKEHFNFDNITNNLNNRKLFIGKSCRFCGKKLIDINNFSIKHRKGFAVGIHNDCWNKICEVKS